MRCLVLGAAGFLGLNLVDALREQCIEPVCGRRRRTNVLPLRSRRVPMVHADLDAPDSLRAAMADMQVVFHVAGHYPRTSLDPEGSLQLGLSQLDRVLDAAAHAGVARLIYVSSTATVARQVDRAADEEDTFVQAPAFGTYHRLKWHMEARVLAEARLDVRVACPSGCIGPWDLRVGTSALVVGTARGLCPPHPDGIVSLVDARDVAEGLIALAGYEGDLRRVILSGGDYGLHDTLHMLSRRYGVAPPSPPLTADAAKALADEQEQLAERTQQRPTISREIVDLIVHGGRLNTRRAEQALGLSWRPLHQTLETFDEWARRMRIIESTPPTQELCT